MPWPWFIKMLSSSVGKKQMMAATGLFFILFLFGHLAGNCTLYLGRDSFNSYAAHLHSLGPLVHVAEIGLLAFACVHVLTGLYLFYRNVSARSVRYHTKTWAGGRTIFSATMPYTGLLLLAFVAVHLLTFHFVDHERQTIFQIASRVFSHPGYVAFYMFSMVVAGFHVRHGLWSAFQTLGANHPKYMDAVSVLSILFALAVGVGFGVLPLVVRALA
jgi:succinate dehydrogenase / fumarate reductase cytochrome b subunit